jgi:hypothetical protein
MLKYSAVAEGCGGAQSLISVNSTLGVFTQTTVPASRRKTVSILAVSFLFHAFMMLLCYCILIVRKLASNVTFGGGCLLCIQDALFLLANIGQRADRITDPFIWQSQPWVGLFVHKGARMPSYVQDYPLALPFNDAFVSSSKRTPITTKHLPSSARSITLSETDTFAES